MIELYRRTPPEDLDSHYQLMIESSVWQEYFESELAEMRKVWAQLRTAAEEVEARKSKELSPTKITEGERLAAFDPGVVAAKMSVADAKYACDLKEAQARMMERVYFTSKDTLDRAHKKLGR